MKIYASESSSRITKEGKSTFAATCVNKTKPFDADWRSTRLSKLDQESN